MLKRKLSFLAGVALIGMAATSCGNDENLNSGGGILQDGVEINLAFNDGGETRAAARPVTSSEADNNVNEVKIALFLSGENSSYTQDQNVTLKINDENIPVDGNGYFTLDWTPLANSGVQGNVYEGRDVTRTITAHGLVEGKTYRIVAFGYDKENGTELTTISAPVNGIFTATITDKGEVEEIFAGMNTITVAANSVKNTTVLLKRQVAGFLGYFKNIPCKVENDVVAGVRVVASGSASAYRFGGTTYLNANHTDPQTYYYQNATEKSEKSVMIYDQKIPVGAGSKDGHYTFQQKIDKVYVAPNSLLSGKFLVAFPGQEGKATFTIELYDATGKTIKTFTVKNTSGNSFDVNRNQFYMIGQKYTNGKIPAPDPENPDEDPEPQPDPANPDEPIDLSVDNEIIITINDAWNVIHNLTIE